MTAATAATSTLRVAALVMACDFRHPAVLAKELASIDVLSGGRLEVGLGAGYNPLDYRRSGIPMDPPGVRVARLIEYVAVLRALFAGGVVDFHGEHFHIDDLESTPLPATPGGPPILVAGGGPRLLRFAATAADIVGVNPSTAAGRGSPATMLDAMPAAIDEKIALLRDAAGARWESLELNAWLSTASVTDRPSEAVAGLAAFVGADTGDVLDSPIVLAGSAASIADQLLAATREVGILVRRVAAECGDGVRTHRRSTRRHVNPMTDAQINLARFEQHHPADFIEAFAEIESGRKRAHWMWFIFPQLTLLGHSDLARYYGINTVEEACAYLSHPLLGTDYARIVEAVREQVVDHSRSLIELMGSPDDLKLVSSLTLFGTLARRIGTAPLAALAADCEELLAVAVAQGYPPCADTLAFLGAGS